MHNVAAAYPVAAWEWYFIFPTVGEVSGVPQSDLLSYPVCEQRLKFPLSVL